MSWSPLLEHLRASPELPHDRLLGQPPAIGKRERPEVRDPGQRGLSVTFVMAPTAGVGRESAYHNQGGTDNDSLFADETAGEAHVRAAVAEVERARAEVRLIHLLTHLQTRAVLTEAQRRLYHEARWGRN